MRAAIGLREICAAAGLGLTTVGLAMIYVPAALIVPGLLLFGLAVWPLLRSGGGTT
jgi:hypothetical protein